MNRNVISGRGGELATIERLLAGLGGGAATRFLLVEGEPGIGKTTLIDACTERAAHAGHIVLSGRATELERELPFGVLTAALDRYLQALPGRALSDLDQDLLAELAAVFPALRELAPDGRTAPGPGSRIDTYMALAAMLEHLAQNAPLVLALDDVQWADRASVESLTYLLCRPPVGPILIACAWRRGQIDPVLAAEIGQAHRAGTAELLELGPLDPAAVNELLADRTCDDAAAELYAASGGNPFFLLELAGSRESPAARTATEGIPASVTAAIAAELARIEPAARNFAEAGAVAGDPFDVDLATRIAAMDLDAAAGAVDRLVAADVLRPTERPRFFAFRHPLVRGAIYESIPPGRRLRDHASCAAALADRGAAESERAPHVEHSAEPGDADAVAVLAAAAAASCERAPASAVSWLRSALRLLPAGVDPGERFALVVQLPPLLFSLNNFRGALEALNEAIALASTEPIASLVELSIAAAAAESVLGEQARADERLTRTLAAIPDQASPEAVSVKIAQAAAAIFSGDYEEMREVGLRAADSARTLSPGPLLAAGLGAAAQGCAFATATTEAVELRGEAIGLIDSLSDDQLALRLDAIGSLAGAELYLDQFEDAYRHAMRGLAIGRRTGTLARAPALAPTAATAAWMLGRPREAIEMMEAAVAEARTLGSEQALAWSLLNLCGALTIAGDRNRALSSGRECLRLADQVDSGMIASWGALVYANALVELGEGPGSGLDVMQRHNAELLTDIPGGWRCFGLEVMTRAALASDRTATAERATAAALEQAERSGLPMANCWATTAASQLALARGESERALEYASEAITLAESVCAAIDANHARLQAGRALISIGEREQATEMLRAAADGFDRAQAPRMREEAERELGRLGKRPHRRSRGGSPDEDGLATLTGREMEVARLVVDRRTNAEIATALFLSTKTVESHLRNIFRKLDVASRVEVARAVETGDGAGFLDPSA